MKTSLTVILLVIILVGGFWLVRGTKNSTVSEKIENGSQNATSTATPSSSQVPVKDPAWDTLVMYLARLKAHDIEGTKALSYQQSETCKNKATENECFKLMDSAYSIGENLKQSSFTHRFEDAKQLILTTDIEKDAINSSMVGLVRGQVIFTKTPLGAYQVLSYDLGKGVYHKVTSSSTIEKVYEELIPIVKDTDNDGLFDGEEMCTGDFASVQCKKTDATKKDSDNDGWWDGVEIFFRTN